MPEERRANQDEPVQEGIQISDNSPEMRYIPPACVTQSAHEVCDSVLLTRIALLLLFIRVQL